MNASAGAPPTVPVDAPDASDRPHGKNATLALAALGVVFGDIGTSPLYAFSQCFNEGGGFPARPEHVFGILSLIFWALVGVVCFKYAFYILRADHDGEGGTLALYALLRPKSHGGIPPRLTAIALLVLFGSAMLYGDGVITPAISVLSALEGLDVATKAAHPYILPITIAILTLLFVVQSRGTGRIGAIFGPIMTLWFAAIGAGGAVAIARRPDILLAVNPAHAVGFILRNHWAGFLVLGAVVLCVSGVEALYADLGHFGKTPIRLAWSVVVFPALLLNYFGQGALTLSDPKLVSNAFYALYPGPYLLYPMVALATLATVIASQALISGAFSLTQQAMQLGYLPRLRVVHTSQQHQGQIFVPLVNAMLAVACIALVLAFQTSARLGSAYGLAVTVTMTATSVTFFYVAIRRWSWSTWHAGLVVGAFMLFDLSFLVSNMLKIVSGAWVPLAIASCIMVLFTTWVEGRRRQATALAELSVAVEDFERDVAGLKDALSPETAVFFTPQTTGIPFVLRHRWLRAHVLHEEIVLLTIVHARRPHIPLEERVTIETINPRLKRILAHYGFMERPLIDEILACAERQHGLTLQDPTYFLVDPKIRRSHGSRSFPSWRRWLLIFLMRNARPLTEYLHLPIDRVVQFGVEVRV